MNDFEASAIYCDDVRVEIGSKHSYMGVYNGELLVAEFPSSLAKLCAVATVRVPISTPLKSVVVRALLGDETLAEVTVPPEDFSAISAQAASMSAETDSRISMNMVMTFSPLNLAEATTLRVRAFINDQEVKANALRIRTPTHAEKQSPGFPLRSPT